MDIGQHEVVAELPEIERLPHDSRLYEPVGAACGGSEYVRLCRPGLCREIQVPSTYVPDVNDRANKVCSPPRSRRWGTDCLAVIADVVAGGTCYSV